MFLPFSKVTQGHCSPTLNEIWMVTLDADHPDDIELRVKQTVGHNTLYVDIGYTPQGFDIYDDFAGDYLYLEGEDLLQTQHSLKNLYFTFYCIDSVSYTVEVRSIDSDASKIVPT